MAGTVPGPLCGWKVGSDWIDPGTNGRWRSQSPGLLGIVASLVMGATPPANDLDKVADANAMFLAGIAIIAKSDFGRSSEGKEIVKLLRELLKSGNIQYGATIDGSRGDWDGTTIRVDEDFRGSAHRTVPELVHEGTHALWRKKHKAQPQDEKERRKADIEDEFHARENQLLMYTYLRDKLGWPSDMLMEMRLERQKNGTLKSTIEQAFEP